GERSKNHPIRVPTAVRMQQPLGSHAPRCTSDGKMHVPFTFSRKTTASAGYHRHETSKSAWMLLAEFVTVYRAPPLCRRRVILPICPALPGHTGAAHAGGHVLVCRPGPPGAPAKNASPTYR